MKSYYIDSSVVLRLIFQTQEKSIIPKDGELVSSVLLRVECFRALDRIYQQKEKSFQQILSARTALGVLMEMTKLVEISKITLERASQVYPSPIKTLDAIHLSTALLYQEDFQTPLVILTHDQQLGRAAALLNFEVQGCDLRV